MARRKTGDRAHISRAITVAKNIESIQHEAAHKLLKATGLRYPHDGCAITLSCLLQNAGIDIPDTYQALAMGQLLKSRGWTVVPVGQQQAGDVGSTCGASASHGNDHVYFVVSILNETEMVVADNQSLQPHFRFTKKHQTPTKFFLRA